MTEELITYETAKLAKEKGFNWKVQNYFKIGVISKPIQQEKCNLQNINNVGISVISVPTQSLLQRWLREEHMIYIMIGHNINGYFGEVNGKGTGCFDTYESNLESGLIQALKLIK